MAKFIVDLSDEHRTMLEAHRRRLGERSLSDAVRRLIEGEKPKAVREPRFASPHEGDRALYEWTHGPLTLIPYAPAKPTPGSRLKKK